MTNVFLDTVGLIALWDEADQWHGAAQQAYDDLIAVKFVGVTTEAILLECGNAASRRPYRQDVFELRKMLAVEGRLLEVTEADLNRAWEEYSGSRSGGPSIVDCTSFTVMRRYGLSDVFTNDQHFAAAGFTRLF